MSGVEEPIQWGIVPVVVLEKADWAAPLADALIEGGLPVAEVTFRSEAAVESIRMMAGSGRMIVGAGTVTTSQQVDEAVEAGATFIVSPGLLPAVVERAQARGVPILPGAVTASEIMQALSLGLDTVKFFPANIHGGVEAIEALGAPFRRVRFVPTGGVNLGNLTTFLGQRNVPAVGGTWMVRPDLIAAGAFEEIVALTRTAVTTAQNIMKEKDDDDR